MKQIKSFELFKTNSLNESLKVKGNSFTLKEFIDELHKSKIELEIYDKNGDENKLSSYLFSAYWDNNLFDKAVTKSEHNKCWTLLKNNFVIFGFVHPEGYLENPKGVKGYFLEIN